MKRQITVFLLALTLLFSLPSDVYGADTAGITPKPENSLIADEAQVMNQETIEKLQALGEQTQYDTGTSVVVITVDYSGTYDLDAYADKVFDVWNIEDGIVLVLSIGDEDYYAMPSAGLGRYLSSYTISNMLNDYLEPDFAAADYNAGIEKTYAALCEKVEDLYQKYVASAEEEPSSVPAESRYKKETTEREKTNPLDVVPGLFIIAVVIHLISRRRKKRLAAGYIPKSRRRTPPPPPRDNYREPYEPNDTFYRDPSYSERYERDHYRDDRDRDRDRDWERDRERERERDRERERERDRERRQRVSPPSSSSSRSDSPGRGFGGGRSSFSSSSSSTSRSSSPGKGFGGGGSRGGGAGRKK